MLARKYVSLWYRIGVLLSLALAASADAGLTITSARFGHLFQDGEEVAVAVRIATGPAAVTGWLEVDVMDPYDASILRVREPIALATFTHHVRHLVVPPGVRGAYRIDAALVGDDGAPVWGATTTLGVVPPPPHPADDDESAVGYFAVPTEYGPFDETPVAWDVARQMQLLGVKWVRYVHRAFPADARPERPDVADPSWLDTTTFAVWVDAYRAHGIQVLGGLAGVARWASTRPEDERIDPRVGAPYWQLSHPRLEDWDHYCRTMVRRFRDRIRHWELWNEPDTSLYYEPAQQGRALAGATFAALVATSHAAIADEDPGASLVLNLGPPTDVALFETAFLPQAGPLLDVFGYHYGDGDAVALAGARLQAAGVAPKPFWNLEASGLPADQLSRWIRQRAAGAERSFPFVWNIFGDGLAPKLGSHPLGAGYAVEPLAIAVRTLSDMIGRATFVRHFRIDRTEDLSGYVFTDGTRTVTAILRESPVELWLPSRPPLTVRVRRGTTAVRTTDLMGNTRVLVPDRRRLIDLPAHGNPIFVEGIDLRPLRPLRVVRRRR